ncbi:MAG: tRNA (adenosine(37)-N6)-dimethylallyltransferase MiaA [Chthoniobacteraceae bacterium]
MTEPIFIAGPTASGKSDVAVAVAEHLGGEIVGADAFQVYRGLDLLTAKPDAATLARVPHHLIGEIPLSETFDVALYRTLAEARIADIASRNRVPVIVGGTGLYMRALTHGLAELPPADPALRAQLEARALDDLVAELDRLDPTAQLDRKNPRRVLRALEVCLLTGKPFSSFREQARPARAFRGVLLTRERAGLYSRINQRTEQMFAAGVVDEVRAVGEISATTAQAIGLREIKALLRGELTEPESIASIQQQTRNYARRQLTWFRRETHFTPLLVADGESSEAIAARLLASISAR